MGTWTAVSSWTFFALLGTCALAGDDGGPRFDVDHWRTIFPYESLFHPDRPRHFDSTPPDSPLDLRKPGGRIITTPESLIQDIQVREAVDKVHPLKESSKSDVFVWGKPGPSQPFLTRIGGVPYRPQDSTWPSRDGTPCTFLFQLYFGDSRDLLQRPVPGDVMVVFATDEEFWSHDDGLVIEWHDVDPAIHLPDPALVPAPRFPMPELIGHRCRIPEYAGSEGVFDGEGHDDTYLLAAVQATKIGTDTHWIQHRKLKDGETLFATFSSISINEKSPWPLVDVQDFPYAKGYKGYHGYQNELGLSMADVGCVYFIQDAKGGIRWVFQSY